MTDNSTKLDEARQKFWLILSELSWTDGDIDELISAAREEGRKEQREKDAEIAGDHSCGHRYSENCDCRGYIAAAIRRGDVDDQL